MAQICVDPGGSPVPPTSTSSLRLGGVLASKSPMVGQGFPALQLENRVWQSGMSSFVDELYPGDYIAMLGGMLKLEKFKRATCVPDSCLPRGLGSAVQDVLRSPCWTKAILGLVHLLAMECES